MKNANIMVLGNVPQTSPILSLSNEVPRDLKKLIRIFNKNLFRPWWESKEKARELNKIWQILLKDVQLNSSLSVNQPTKKLPFYLNCNLTTLSKFFTQLEGKGHIETSLYVQLCSELRIPKRYANKLRVAIFQCYLDTVVFDALREILDYRILQYEGEAVFDELDILI